MALSYNTTIVKVGTDALAIQLYDDTGVYDATTNTGGFGSPNVTKASITVSVLQVYEPGATDVSRSINLYDAPYTFPVTENTVTVDSKALLGVDVNTQLTDGVWQFRSKITAGGTGYTSIKYLFYLNSAEACISRQALKITECACEDKAVKKYQEMRRFYDAAVYAFDNDDYEKAQVFAEKLTALCNDDCGCGC